MEEITSPGHDNSINLASPSHVNSILKSDIPGRKSFTTKKNIPAKKKQASEIK